MTIVIRVKRRKIFIFKGKYCLSSHTAHLKPPFRGDSVGNWPSLVCTPITPTITYCKTKNTNVQSASLQLIKDFPCTVLGPSL